MPEWINNANFVFWAAVVIMVAVPTIAHYLYKAHKVTLEHNLKMQMVSRGMSSGEIEQVLRASSKRRDEEQEAIEEERAG
jgi:hypothetical protein